MDRRNLSDPRPPPPPPPPNPFLSLPSLLLSLGSELSCRLDESRRFALSLAASFPPPKRVLRAHLPPSPPLFASVTQQRGSPASHTAGGHVARSLVGTAVYTVSNSNNEFVLVSDRDGSKSIGLLCFRQEDAESFLAQVRLRRRELKGQARVVPITLDQIDGPLYEDALLLRRPLFLYFVYLLKVEGIAFRFMPDPVQIKNALELKAADTKSWFDGVPVFQSDLLVVKKKNRRFCPIYFRKEDIEKELSMISRASRGSSQHIMVGSLEDVLQKMEISEKNSGWEDIIFIPPGKSHSQHIQEVMKS